MNRPSIRIFILWLLMGWGTVQAETLVLLPGYLGSQDSWRSAGITGRLVEGGWTDAGRMGFTRGRPYGPGQTRGDRGRRFVTVDLPTQAPLMVQAQVLDAYLKMLRERYPDSALILAGHSAGGVVGRLYMVEHPDAGIIALISFASPHRGTQSAELGLTAGRSPLAWIAPMVGADVLNRSQGLYQDLARENPGNLLGWLNRQPHPGASYVSVVRREGKGGLMGLGDMVVPEWSQDMGQVFALRGRARTVYSEGGHGLESTDGRLLLNILDSLNRT